MFCNVICCTCAVLACLDVLFFQLIFLIGICLLLSICFVVEVRMGLSFFASDFQWCCLTDQGSPSAMQHIVSVESSSLLLHSLT